MQMFVRGKKFIWILTIWFMQKILPLISFFPFFLPFVFLFNKYSKCTLESLVLFSGFSVIFLSFISFVLSLFMLDSFYSGIFTFSSAYIIDSNSDFVLLFSKLVGIGIEFGKLFKELLFYNFLMRKNFFNIEVICLWYLQGGHPLRLRGTWIIRL